MKPLRGTQLKRFLRAVERPATEIVLLLEDVEDPVNVGSAFRIADAAKVSSMILAGITPAPPHRLIDKVGRGKDRRVPWKKVDDPLPAIAELKERGFHVVAIELTERAEPYYARAWPEKVCLIVGHEDHGVPRKVLEVADSFVFIPMYGKGASLNVHVALGIVTFHVLHARIDREAVSSERDAE
jgi:tRNA (guanosine-2'-O-)-methyltransferase